MSCLRGAFHKAVGLEELCCNTRMLRKHHSAIGDKVLDLVRTDIVRHSFKWAATVKEIRGSFARLAADGFSPDSQRAWRQHWDYQIYKALNCQYSRGLHDVNAHLQEVHS